MQEAAEEREGLVQSAGLCSHRAGVKVQPQDLQGEGCQQSLARSGAQT